MWVFAYVVISLVIQAVAGQNDCRCLDKTGCPDTCNSLCESGFSGSSCHSANIARGQSPRFSFSTVVQSGTPEQTVDGNTDSNCVSVSGSNQRWEIQFAETRTITKVRIFWSATDLPQGFIAIVISGFTCYASSAPPTEREVTYSCSSPLRGNRVMVIHQGVGTFTMCEVEIYECVDGFYGLDCTSRCNCGNCDKITGSCPQPDTTVTSTTTSSTTVTTTPITTTTTPTVTTTPTTTTSSTTTPTTATTSSTRTTPTTATTSSTRTTPTTATTSSTATTQPPTSDTPSISTSSVSTTTSTSSATSTTTSLTSSTPKVTVTTVGTSTVKSPDGEKVYGGPGDMLIAAIIVGVIALVLIIIIIGFACRINRDHNKEGRMKDPKAVSN